MLFLWKSPECFGFIKGLGPFLHCGMFLHYVIGKSCPTPFFCPKWIPQCFFWRAETSRRNCSTFKLLPKKISSYIILVSESRTLCRNSLKGKRKTASSHHKLEAKLFLKQQSAYIHHFLLSMSLITMRSNVMLSVCVCDISKIRFFSVLLQICFLSFVVNFLS